MATKQSSSRLIYFDGLKSITFDSYPEEAWKYFTGGTHSEDKTVQALYQTLAVMFRGVTLRANGVSSMPFAIYNSKDEEIDSSDDYKNALGFLPNPKQTLRLVESCLTLVGAAYLYQVRSTRRVLKLKYFVPTTIEPIITEKDGLTGFKRLLSTGTQPLKLEDVIYFWQDDPMVEIGLPTTSPAKAGLNAGGVLANVDEFMAGFFKRGAIKAMLLTVEDMPDKAEREKLESWWKNVIAGVRNAFGAKVINAKKVTPVVVGEGLKELENQALTQEKREEVAIALGIPQTMLFSDAANFATAQQDDLWFLTKTIVPECEFIAEVLNTQLLISLGYRIAFLPETLDAFQEDENQRAGAYAAYVNTGMKPSIAAQLVGLELPEGVEYEDLDPEEEPEPEQPAVPPANETMTPPIMEGAESVTETGTTVAAMYADLERWKRKAMKALKDGKSANVSFTSDVIPRDISARLSANLESCTSTEAVKAAFENMTASLPYAVETQSATAVLEGLRLAVEALRITATEKVST